MPATDTLKRSRKRSAKKRERGEQAFYDPVRASRAESQAIGKQLVKMRQRLGMNGKTRAFQK
jgi:hypothetical protein